jgi:drug/metabolite transporter (DMT)-like permease
MWIFYGLLSHLAWAFVNTGDKYLLSNRIKHPIVYLHLLGSIFGIIGFIGLVIFGFPILDFVTLGRIFLAGALWFFGGLPYLFAVKIEEVTRINIWWSLIAVFSFLLGFILFGETLTLREGIGFGILVGAAAIAAVHVSRGVAIFSKAVLYMAAACLVYALYAVILHDVMQTVSFGTTFLWTSVSIGISAQFLLFFSKVRKRIKAEALYGKKRTMVFAVGIAITDQIGSFLNHAALALAPAALVFSMEGSQVLFVFLITIIVARFNKDLLKESFEKKNLLLKIFATGLMLIGIWILAI